MITYWEAEEAKTIATTLIANDKRFLHIQQLHPKIIYLFYKGISPKSIVEIATCEKRSSLNKFISGHDFVIKINHDVWSLIDANTRLMVCAHELSHVMVKTEKDGSPKLGDDDLPIYAIRKHDIEDFKFILTDYPNAHKCISEALEILIKKAEDEKEDKKEQD
jgi:oligoribonuclease (3'-5' exoribonuclease)